MTQTQTVPTADATVTLNANFSIITDSSVSTYKYSQFYEEVSKYNTIIVSASYVSLAKLNKYIKVLLSMGYTEKLVQWNTVSKVGNTDVATSRIHFSKNYRAEAVNAFMGA
jgi:hypothetical protein